MENLVITKENALKAYSAGCNDVKSVLKNLLGARVFEVEKITDRIKTLDDVFAAAGTTSTAFYETCKRNELAQDEVGYRLAKLVTLVLNEGWEPDWDNSSQRKWRLWFYLNQPGFRLNAALFVLAISSVGSRLCFKSEELALYAANTFLDVYKQFFTA